MAQQLVLLPIKNSTVNPPKPTESVSDTESVTVSETEKDSDSESESVSECEKAPAHARGEFGWVKLTDKQYAKLLEELGQEELDRCIRYVDESAQSTGNKNRWKDWNLTIRKCHRDGWGLKQNTQSKPKKFVTAADYVPPKPKSAQDVWSLVDKI